MAVQLVFKDGGEVDGAGGGCFVGVVCHAAFHFLKSNVELDEVGVEEELDKAKVNMVRVEGEFRVAGVNGALEDEVDVEKSRDPYHARCPPATV